QPVHPRALRMARDVLRLVEGRPAAEERPQLRPGSIRGRHVRSVVPGRRPARSERMRTPPAERPGHGQARDADPHRGRIPADGHPLAARQGDGRRRPRSPRGPPARLHDRPFDSDHSRAQRVRAAQRARQGQRLRTARRARGRPAFRDRERPDDVLRGIAARADAQPARVGAAHARGGAAPSLTPRGAGLTVVAALAAGLAAAVVSVPLALAALTAARTFGRAAARYRLVGIAFALCAATAPLGYWLARGLAHVAVRAALPLAGIPPASGPLPLVGAALIAGGAAVAAILLLLLARDVVRLRRVKRRAVPLGLGGPRGATVATSADVVTPTAIGYLHPAIVVPAGFRARVDAGEWEAVLAHERAHLARRDDWAKALQSACSRAGWWIPGLWLLGRALDLERELASDERAAGETGPRR